MKHDSALAPAKGAYCENSDLRFAGTHILLEFWGASNLDDLKCVERALTDAVEACGATLLELMLHHFSPYGGVSGVAIIKESHLSIHTWPEYNYAALDVFTCGTVDPHNAIPVLREAFQPDSIQMSEHKRGVFL